MNLHYLLIVGLSGTAVALLLLMISPGTVAHGEYWFRIFPALVTGSFSNECAITAVWYVVLLSNPTRS